MKTLEELKEKEIKNLRVIVGGTNEDVEKGTLEDRDRIK